MRENFDQAFDFVIGAEGGYSNDKDDPGGETMFGISKRAYPDLDIKGLTLDKAKAIYLTDYWIKAGCDDLFRPFDLCVFDCAVNQGVGRARALLKSSKSWEVFLLNRIAHYKSLNKPKYFAGWVNRVVNLFNKIQGGL